MIDRGTDRKARLLMDQPWLERRGAVEILPQDDSGESGDNKKRMFRLNFFNLLKLKED